LRPIVEANKSLVEALTSKLIEEFGKRGHHKGRGTLSPYDPWWWPATPANLVENWGLTREQGETVLQQWYPPAGHRNDVFASLCDVPLRVSNDVGFRGSIGATARCIFVLGERPSFNRSFASASTKLLKRIESLQAYYVFEINPLCDLKFIRAKADAEGSLNVHVTDVVKFRGPTPRDGPGCSSQLPLIFDGPDPERMIHVSVQCLEEELRLLDPVLILRTHLAKKAMGEIRSRYPDSGKAIFDEIEQHPGLVEVLHWSSDADSNDWPLRVRERLSKDTALTQRVGANFSLHL
jgi:hypothetical protein